MLNELITWVLNTYLGKYLEDFNPAQLSVALLSGEVELENVPIRKDALRSFGIPIQVQSGCIGKIKLQIPLRQFRTAAWCIVIEHVYGVISPKDLNEWDYDKEKNSEHEYKLEVLSTKEADWRAENRHLLENYYSSSYTSWLKYGTSLGTSILENLELKINDVHLRFEDCTTYSNIKYAGGIKIASLTAQSCDSNWISGSKGSRDVNATYKIIELTDFSLYWDKLHDENICCNLNSKELLHQMNALCNIEEDQFIISPISAKAKCKREKCREALRSRLRPRLSCDLLISEVRVTISDVKYQEMLNCTANLQQLSKVLIYRTKRPASSVLDNATLWWKYAAECNGFIFSNTDGKWNTLRENLRYIRICKNIMLNPNFNISNDDKEFKSNFEKARSLDELATMRNVCFRNVFAKELNMKARTVNQGRSMLFHWFPTWRGWYGNTETAVVAVPNDAYKELEDDILNELESSWEIENDSYSKRDAVLCCFTMTLVKGQFIMKVVVKQKDTRFNENKRLLKTIFEMEFQQLITMFELRPRFDSYLIGLSLGSVCLKDMLTEGSHFPNIIKPQTAAATASSMREEPAKANFKRNFIKAKDFDATEPWFQLQYEKKPPQLQSDYSLAIKSKGLDIFYNHEAFDRLICFWLIPLQKQQWYIEEKQKTSSLKFLQNWRDALMSHKVHPRSWSFEIDIFAPRIIFAENLLDENTIIILADFGRLKVIKTDEQRKEPNIADKASNQANDIKKSDTNSEEDDELFMTPCSTPPGSQTSLSESPTLHHDTNVNLPNFVINNDTDLESAFYEKIYDKYYISLSDLQVLICKNQDLDLPLFKSSSNFHLLDKFDISLNVERRNIYTADPEYPLFTLHGTLSRIVAHVNEQRIGEFLKILLPILSNGYLSSSNKNRNNNAENERPEREAINDEEALLGNDENEKSGSSSNNTNIIILDFIIGQLILEIQSCDKSLAELQVIGARASITKKLKETHIRMSVHGLLLVDAIQSFGPDFELLIASHRHVGMDSMSGSLKHSEPCSPIAPESPDPSASQRPTSPHIISKAVDFLTAGNSGNGLDFDEIHALITIDINLFDTDDESESPFQLANISFNNLDVIANQETITELMGFLKRTYDTYKFYQMEKDEIVIDAKNQDDPIVKNSSSSSLHRLRTKLNFDFHRLNILVVATVKKEDYTCARKVSTLIMSEAKIHATFGKDVYTTGSLGGIQIIDITPEGINHQRILSVGKDPLTEPPNMGSRDLLCALANEMYTNSTQDPPYDELNALVFKVYGGKNSHVNLKIRMASVWYTHCPRFIHEMNICISQFKTYFKNFAKSLRSKAAHMAIGLVQQISEATHEDKRFLNKNDPKISMDIVLNSPVLVLPRSSQSCDVFVANLGKITAYNTYESSESTVSHCEDADSVDVLTKECYFLDIRNINLYSLNTSKRKDIRLAALPKADEFYSCKNDALAILYDTAMQFKFTKLNKKIKNNLKWQYKNIFLIQGSVTQVLQVSLSRLQYEQLNESLENATKMDFGSMSQTDGYKDHSVGLENELRNDIDNASQTYETQVSFSVPIFKIHLKNEHNNSIIRITFREFNIQNDNYDGVRDLEVKLRSILIEDLKCAKSSRLRNMVDCSSDNTREKLIKNSHNSASCPNLANFGLRNNHLSTSMPSNLDCTSQVIQTRTSRKGVFNADPKLIRYSTNASSNSAFLTKRSINNGGNISQNEIAENLVIYKSVTKTLAKADGKSFLSTNSSIDFNCLNLTISLDKWFIIFDFFGLISADDVPQNLSPKNEIKQDQMHHESELKISVRSLNLILVRSEMELSKANISNAYFNVIKETAVNNVGGYLGSLSLYDLTPFGALYKEKFSTTGSEALRFSYKRLTAESKRSLEMDAFLKIQMSSVRYIHTKRFIMELHLFINELLQLQTPVINRIKIPENSERNVISNPFKIGLDIHAGSPIILLPLCYHSNQLLVADLGEFTLKNQFHYASDSNVISTKRDEKLMNEILDVMHVDLVNTNIFAGERIIKNEKLIMQNLHHHKSKEPDNYVSDDYNDALSFKNFYVKKVGNNLIKETCYLKLQVERNTDSGVSHNCPDISVKGTFSKLNATINLQQYKLIRGFLSYNLGEDIDDVYYNYSNHLCESIERLNLINQVVQKHKELNVWTMLSITILLENVSIVIAEPLAYATNNMSNLLACINFIKSSLEIDSYSDGSQDIDLISSEILILDSRENNNVFKYILQPKKGNDSKNIVQAEIHCRKKPNSSKYTILLNDMRVMAILDCLERLKNFFKEEPYISSLLLPVVQSQMRRPMPANYKSQQLLDEDESIVSEIVLNVTDSELVFAEDFTQSNTNAIILKNTTVFSYKPKNLKVPVSIDINHLEIFSCMLGLEEQSALSIIDPFSLNLEIRENSFNLLVQKQLNIRLSYNDIKLFRRMLHLIPTQKIDYDNPTLEETFTDLDAIAPLIAMGFSQKDSLHAMEMNNFKLNDAAIWLSQQRAITSDNPFAKLNKVILNAHCVSICIIDDCMDSDVPLLELSLSQLKVEQNLRTDYDEANLTFFGGQFDTIFGCNYYNRRLSGWEPFIESWECMVLWKYREQLPIIARNVRIDVTSKQLLKVNVTTTLIELCDVVRNNWIKDYYNLNLNHVGNLRQRSPFVPFALQNLTGEPLLFKTMVSQPGGITRTAINNQDMMLNWVSVQPNEVFPFDFGPQSKLRHFDSHKLNLHQILVQIHGWTLIGPISVDKVGTYFRYATKDHKYIIRTRIVFEITLIGSAQKLITVRSALNVVNKMNKKLIMKLHSNEDNTSCVMNIDAGEKLSIPLRLVDFSIFIKPCCQRHSDTDSGKGAEQNDAQSSSVNIMEKAGIRNSRLRDEDIGFCNHGISWLECTKEAIQNLNACYSSGKTIFYFVSVIRRDKFPMRDLANLPGHTITLLPPLKIRNMLSCDLLFKIAENVSGRISASKEIDIYSVKSSESFSLSITLDNYKLSGQLKIPTGHSGVVEPKLKLIDVLNRELYLRVSIQSYQGRGMEIYISAPVWIINRTGLPLVYRQEGASQQASGQFDEHEIARVVSPLLFSFSDDDASPSLEFRLGNSYGNNNPWCKSFNTHKDIFYRELRAEASKGSYAVGIYVRRGRGLYACTTFVKLTPRFQLCNKTSKTLEFAQKCDIIDNEVSARNIISALPECSFPFHWPNGEQEPLLCVRLAEIEFCHWSKGIPINEVQSFYVNIRSDLGEMFFLRLEVILKGATYMLIFTDAHTLPPPIRIDNYSNVLINFHQTGCKPLWRTVVKPLSSIAYVLDDPMGMMSLQIEVPGGNAIEFSLNHFDRSHSITYANFIYIAFKDTFNPIKMEALPKHHDVEDELVLTVRDRKVVVARKCNADRSQLWLMNPSGQLEHEGSSPPLERGRSNNPNCTPRMVLDIEKSLNPLEYCPLVVRPPNKQRMTTQSWRFEDGRLICHANLCVQVRNGICGLYAGSEAVLGRFNPMLDDRIPMEQHVEIQKLRPGSGQLEIKSKMDGPIHAIQIIDVKANQEGIVLNSDPSWSHTSISTGKLFDDVKNGIPEEYSIKFDLPRGLGLSIVTRQPCEELLFTSLENINVDIFSTPFVKSIEIKVMELQIDNQLLDSCCPILLHTIRSAPDSGSKETKEAVVARAKVLPSPNRNAIIFEEFLFNIKPCVVYLEERLILKTALFLGYGEMDQRSGTAESNWDDNDFEENDLARNSTRYYFEHLSLGSTQVRLSVFTTPKLSPELQATKKLLGLTLLKFEDALIEFERFVDKHHFETLDVYLKAIKTHYIDQLKWGAATILGSVDFLGNPLGFANDLSEGVTGLIFEGSVKSLVKNVTHGISNSTAKLTETLSDSLGRVVLDDQDNETRQKILELQSNTSGGHLAAGFKGLGFGLLGGVTSIVRHTYVGAQADGLPGFFRGLGKGVVGTVTKPIIGVLDLASETATAVRESSRGSHRTIPSRRRMPRCVTGAPGGLLPAYSFRQSKGQQYLYLINRRTFSEKLLAYEPNLCNEKDAKLRLLVSTEYIRVFSRYDEEPTIMFECHLSEVLSCHPLTTNQSGSKSSSKAALSYYIEISTNLPKITRPRIRCQNEEIAENAARCINYAKSVFDEREQSVSE